MHFFCFQLLDKLNEERDHVADVVRQEFADKLVATDEENRRIKNEMAELKARHRMELERAKTEMELIHKSKEEEMEQVHERYVIDVFDFPVRQQQRQYALLNNAALLPFQSESCHCKEGGGSQPAEGTVPICTEES